MVARLEHPHIVPLYDFWREPGGAYLVFRLLRGGTAEQVLVSTGPLDLPSVTRLLEQIGGALGCAHAAGVIHRDVKPANILFDDDGEAYLTDFGIATAAVEHNPSPSSESPRPYGRWSAGSPMYASPEQARDGFADARADQYALAATVWELLTGQPPFEGATAAEVIKAKLDSPLAPVRLLRPDVPARLEEVLARASAIHPDDRFATVAEFVASWQSALAVSLTTTTAPPEASTDGRSGERLGATALTMSGLVVNPFKGLRPFGEADAADFFGRDQIVGELHQLVNEQRFTAVVGPSGSGKSSLVLAGLVPELKRGGFLVCRFTPGADPFDAFSAALIDLATVDQARALSPDLLRREGGLVVAVDALAADDGLVIVIDQLEELWTTTDDDERTLFAASLADLHRASSCARVVATVRADWFDRPLRDPSLGPLVARATFGITPMEASELHTAISEPAARVGVRFEGGLVGRLVTEALDQPGSLPLLQFALAELFDRRSGATITTEVYDQIGGLSGSVAHQAESLYANFTSPDQLAVRRLFARLVTAGDGAEDTRRRARQSELVGVDDQVVNALVDRRLLTDGSRPRVTRTHHRDRPRGTPARMAPTTRVARRGPRLGARITRSGECHPPLGVERSRRRRSVSRRATRGDQRARARPRRFTDARRGRVPGRVGASRRCRADRRRGTDPHEGTTEPPSSPLARRSRRGHDLGADRRSGRSRSKQPRGRPSDRGTGPGSVGGAAIRRRRHTASRRRRAALHRRGTAHRGRGTAHRGRGTAQRGRDGRGGHRLHQPHQHIAAGTGQSSGSRRAARDRGVPHRSGTVAVGPVLDVHPQRRLSRLPTPRRCECGARSRSARRRHATRSLHSTEVGSFGSTSTRARPCRSSIRSTPSTTPWTKQPCFASAATVGSRCWPYKVTTR